MRHLVVGVARSVFAVVERRALMTWVVPPIWANNPALFDVSGVPEAPTVGTLQNRFVHSLPGRICQDANGDGWDGPVTIC